MIAINKYIKNLDQFIFNNIKVNEIEGAFEHYNKTQEFRNLHFDKFVDLKNSLSNANDKPDFLYKYTAINDYTKDNIIGEKIFLNSSNKMNDKLELSYFVDIENKKNIEGYKKVFSHFFARKFNANYITLLDDWKYEYKPLNEGTFIGSLTSNDFSDSMWGLYADKFSGILIKYDFNELLENVYPDDDTSMILQLNKVLYDDKCPDGLLHCMAFDSYNLLRSNITPLFYPYSPIQHLLNLSFAENFKFCLVKHSSWENEKEWRITKLLPGNTDNQFLSAKAKNICFGMEWKKNLDDPDKKGYINEIIRYCEENNIEIKEMVKDYTVKERYKYIKRDFSYIKNEIKSHKKL